MCESEQRQADAAGIEITPAMIEAGAWELRDWLGEGRSESATPQEAFRLGVQTILDAVFDAGGPISWREK